MDWTISATVYAGPLPGAVQLTITGEPNATVKVYRSDRDGDHEVRNVSQLPASGALIIVDPEAPLGRPVTYTIVQGGEVRARSNLVTVPALASGRALLRSVVRPDVLWMEVDFVDETGTQWETSAATHPILGSHESVVVGDVRKRRRGVFALATRTPTEADNLVDILRDGVPFLLRLCPNKGQVVHRDTLFYALNVQETRFGRSGVRQVFVDFQSVDWVSGRTDLPEQLWTYDDLAAQTSAPTYAGIPPLRSDYYALLTNPVTP